MSIISALGMLMQESHKFEVSWLYSEFQASLTLFLKNEKEKKKG
jgi:hypothetical protein